jgi:hypothetical protein
VEDVERLGPSSASCVVFAAGIQRDSKNEGGGVFAYFAGGLFAILGRFCPLLSIFVIFWGLFFRFSLFFDFQIRYTRAANPTLMYSTSRKGFKV